MTRATACAVLGFGLLLGTSGCATMDAPPATPAKPNPFLDELLTQPPLEKKPSSATLKPDFVLNVIPAKTPLAQAQGVMESHGFTCWPGVPEGDSLHLHCIAYKRRPDGRFDRVVVKCYYANKQVTNVTVSVEYAVKHSEHGNWPFF